MKITRPQGIFSIQFDTEKADFEAKQSFNQLGFFAALLIPVIDKLENTTENRHEFKNLLKRILVHCEQITGKHFKSYDGFGNVDNDGSDINAMDVHNITSKAYESAFKFMFERAPSEICAAVELVRKFELNGGDLAELKIEYEPIKL